MVCESMCNECAYDNTLKWMQISKCMPIIIKIYRYKKHCEQLVVLNVIVEINT